MQSVKVIKARQPDPFRSEKKKETILRVAAYCRVSTDAEEQENSYVAQQAHYRDMIAQKAEWTLAGIYADEGITGTSAAKRPQFQKMIRDCEAGQIDLVLTKSISRFSRNTVDCLRYIRALKDLEIPVLFEKEGINTMDSSGEVLLTILASLSQQESASMSENVRLGHVYNFQQGKGMLNPKYFMGYDRGDEPHKMVINPQQAIVVRRIFRAYLEGFSPWMIARQLNAEGIPTATGHGKWYDSTITNILGNEKHCGDLLMQKYYTKDFLTHRVVRNDGRRTQYFVANDHEPIVPKDIHLLVQGELKRRSTDKHDPAKVRFGSTNTLNGRVFCGKCGRKMKRFLRSGDATDWRCEGRCLVPEGTEGRCDLPNIKETEITKAVLSAFNDLRGKREKLIRMEERIHSGEIKRIDALLESLAEQKNWMESLRETREASSSSEPADDQLQLALRDAAAKENRLRYERAGAVCRAVQVKILLEFVTTMLKGAAPEPDDGGPCSDTDDFFRRTAYIPPKHVLDETGRMVRYDNTLAVRYLDRIEVQEDTILVKFKAGLEVKVIM